MANKYIIDWAGYARKARQAAAEGAVLIQNKHHVLPLQASEHIAVFGRMQLHYYKSGTGSGGMVNTKYEQSILEALQEARDIQLDAQLIDLYQTWDDENPFDEGRGWGQEPWSQKEMPISEEVIREASERNEAAIIIIGRTAGEDRDAQNQPGSYLLTETETAMIAGVCRHFRKTVVLLNVGSIIDMTWMDTCQPDAVLYLWQGGLEGAGAAVDLLMGKVSPSGKLTDTIAEHISDYPSDANFGSDTEDIYQEDIYVGYRYFETFCPEKVRYPFGFGLSYTRFQYEFSDFHYDEGMLYLRMRVKNAGNYPGKDVVQLYCRPPQGKLGKPFRNLIGYKKTKELMPGENELLEFRISEYVFSSYDETGATGHASAYVLEEGEYLFYAGFDARNAQFVGNFVIPKTVMVRQLQQALAPVRKFERMKPGLHTDGTVFIDKEMVPQKRGEAARVREEDVGWDAFACEDDQGFQLCDVLDGKVTRERFLSQLSEDDLCCMVCGEGMGSPKVTPGTAGAFGGVTERLQEFGIPCGCCSDGPSGIRMDCGTYAFSIPNGTCLACTFNEELNEELYSYLGAEMRKNRIDIILGPGINIHRHPLNGRNFEYFSEDPLVAGTIAAAQLKGLSRYDVTGAVKHFAVNNQEYARRSLNSVVSERALREIYLKCFELAVTKGHARVIMTSYGAVNGIWTAGNYELNTQILRGEWDFCGLVMTDWWAQINEEGMIPDGSNLSAMIRSQNDLYMVVEDAQGNPGKENLLENLQKGKLSRWQLVRSCSNILQVLLKLPAMSRFLDRISEEEKEALLQTAEEDRVDFDIPFYQIDEHLEIDVSGEDIRKGRSVNYGIQIAYPGFYQMRLHASVDANEVAQAPVTFFANGKILATKTLNGTKGRDEELSIDMGLLAGTNNYVKLYFGQNGIKCSRLSIDLKEKLTRPFWELEKTN